MGIVPSMTFTLVEATPYRLRYLCTTLLNRAGFTILSNNNGGVSPDLRTDAASAAQNGILGLPLYRALGTVVLDQPEARRVLLGESGATPVIVNTGWHIQAQITPRVGPAGVGVALDWAVDAMEGAMAGDPTSAGYAVYTVYSTNGTAGRTAYLDIKLEWSKDDYATA